jgi:AraC family transcriptional regulator
MVKSERARREYVARLNLVLDHINAHLDSTLSLVELARVARFSPFYFHRLFRFLTGESVHDYVSRLRLERAAQMLKTDTDLTITGIALNCGFSSSSNFARAFRAHFGMSARDFRKKWQVQRKKREEPRRGPRYAQAMKSERSTMKPEVRQVPELTVAYVRVLGGYKDSLIGPAFGRVMSWAGARSLIRGCPRVLGVSYDDPSITPADKCRYDACLAVPKGTEPSGDVGIETLPAGRYAVGRYEGSINRIGDAWSELTTWLPTSGFQPDDRPCYEEYMNDGNADPNRRFIVDLYLPVKPL